MFLRMSENATASDLELLKRYTCDRAEDAFAEIVRRHVNLVHSAALRQVRSTQLAEEVAQSTFTDLARNAARLKPDTVLTAWLYQVTRRTAIDVVRREARRQLREQIATEMNAMNATNAEWTHIEPLLDEAMSALDDTDRAAVLLRYFDNKSLREVGATLGTSDDAAQKRVSRAVERLREFFAKRGVTVGASGLAVVISANAVQAAPVGLAFTISTSAALIGTTLATTATITAAKAITMTTLQKTIIGATLVAAIGTGIYQTHQVSDLREQVRSLQSQQALQIQQVRDEASTNLATLRFENEQLKSNAELIKLRGEVARLRTQTQTALIADKSPSPDTSTATDLKPKEEQLPKESWADIGFATPQSALQTRGWAVVNGNRERFKESVHITAAARKILEDMFVQMASASKDPNKERYLQDILDHKLDVEDAILMPMMAENQNKGYSGYRILSQQSSSPEELILQLQTDMTYSPAKIETLKLQRFNNDWKVVIDEEFIKSQR